MRNVLTKTVPILAWVKRIQPSNSTVSHNDFIFNSRGRLQVSCYPAHNLIYSTDSEILRERNQVAMKTQQFPKTTFTTSFNISSTKKVLRKSPPTKQIHRIAFRSKNLGWRTRKTRSNINKIQCNMRKRRNWSHQNSISITQTWEVFAKEIQRDAK